MVFMYLREAIFKRVTLISVPSLLGLCSEFTREILVNVSTKKIMSLGQWGDSCSSQTPRLRLQKTQLRIYELKS